MDAEVYHVENTALLVITHVNNRWAILRALTTANSGAGLLYAVTTKGELLLVTFPKNIKPALPDIRNFLKEEGFNIEETCFSLWLDE